MMAPGVGLAQNLIINNNTTVTEAPGATTRGFITVGSTSGTVGGVPGGTYIVPSGSDVTLNGTPTGMVADLTVASGAGSSGLVQVGGTITLANMVVASGAGSSGTVEVNGGTITSVIANSGYSIGSGGPATFVVSNGGHVVGGLAGSTGANTFVGNNAINAFNPNIVGVLTVEGPGSTYTNNGFSIVGNGATGELNVLDGGAVSIPTASLQVGASRTGTALVSGAGSLLSAGTFLGVGVLGPFGVGTLTITNSATATSGSGTYLALNPGSTGTVVVSNGGSLTSPLLVVGTSGTANLQIQPNSTSTISGQTIVGAVAGTGSIEVTGAGASLAVQNGDLTVGGGGDGTMTVSGGAKVSVTGAGTIISGQCTGTGLVGVFCGTPAPQGGVGTVTVTDPGSVLNTGTGLTVGQFGPGNLTITNSGQVVASAVTVAENAGTAGTLNIGAAAGSAPAAPGTLNAPTVTFGAGTGDIVFNHTDTSGNYEFAPVISGGSATTSFVDVYAGTTVMTGASDYLGLTTIHGGILAAGAANVFSPNSDYDVQTAGTLDLRGNDQTVLSLSNAGLVNMGTGTPPTTVLTTTNYVGHGGTIALNTFLGNDSSPSDRLVINSGSATGNSFLHITNTTGGGALTTGDGILVVDTINGGTTTPGAFALSGRVAAGAFDYNLFRGGVGADAGNDNWYLRSEEVAPGMPEVPGAPEIPAIRPEVPLDTAAPGLASRLGFAMLGTFLGRNGDVFSFSPYSGSATGSAYASYGGVYDSYDSTNNNSGGDSGGFDYCGDDVETQKSGLYTKAQPKALCTHHVWGQVFGETGSSGGSGSGNGGLGGSPAYTYDFGGFKAGGDLYRDGRDDVGLYAVAAAMQSSVLTASGGPAGQLGMDAYGFGSFWTHRNSSGWYTDLVLEGNWYQHIHTSSVEGQSFDTQGWGFTTSAETGYRMSFGGGYGMVPQAQLIYQHTAIDDGADQFGRISFGATDQLFGRLGDRFVKSWFTADGLPVSLWIEPDIWHWFGGNSKTTFTNLQGAFPTTFEAGPGLGSTWGRVGVGLYGKLTRNVAVFGKIDYSAGFSGAGHSLSGRAGFRVVW